ncbi:DUF3365 domain-containing protein [Amphritea sp. 1_MG-2023]|uniref:HD domain-containing phosphohydrolase n=1 Tax=Amphritea sp. 1_MG-2023 TaxID=3062670 RepID=UPI0026E3D7BD|nr:HD domain-containing phosphohydrolase [Amphritea sp. 1_MG-2023]MDO6561960.1 DUF3365 domain-containing protein [Amphritea sp. 1_MG-2023]
MKYGFKVIHQYHKNLLLFSVILIVFAWTVTIVSVGGFNAQKYFKIAEQLALNEAEVSVKKDLAYRTWVSIHGGVYVPVTEKTPPNPYLSHLKNRDVTINGKPFTLMNPAYSLSQMMQDYSQLYGIKAKITSKILLNPKNASDVWEAKALDEIDKTRERFYEIAQIKDKGEFLRYMNPLVTKKSCLKCHGHQGYKVGDIRGGVAVSIPMKKHYALAKQETVYLLGSLLVIWVLGLILLLFGYRRLQFNIKQKFSMYEQYIYSLVDIIEQRDSYTAGHTRRVAEYSQVIAKAMHFSDNEVSVLYRAAMLHDIGKISTPDAILLKPGRLSPLEYSLIQEHATASYDILKSTDLFAELAEIVRHHHERYDGKGYPQGLKGDEIPVIAYVLSLADAFDAMTTDRIYKGRKTVPEALKEIKAMSGTQFHPLVAKFALDALKNITIERTPFQKPKTNIEKERFAYFYKDQLTGLYNGSYLKFILSHQDSEFKNYNFAYGVYLHHITKYNADNGWSQGNTLLYNFANELVTQFPNALIFRLFGDDFVVLHQEHIPFPEADLFKSLQDSGVSFTIKHIDIREKSLSVSDLQNFLQSLEKGDASLLFHNVTKD